MTTLSFFKTLLLFIILGIFGYSTISITYALDTNTVPALAESSQVLQHINSDAFRFEQFKELNYFWTFTPTERLNYVKYLNKYHTYHKKYKISITKAHTYYTQLTNINTETSLYKKYTDQLKKVANYKARVLEMYTKLRKILPESAHAAFFFEMADKNYTTPEVNPFSCPDKNAPRQIQLLTPNGNEKYTAGDKISIKWKTCNIPSTETIRMSLTSLDELYTIGLIDTLNDGYERVTLPTKEYKGPNIPVMFEEMKYGYNFQVTLYSNTFPGVFDRSHDMFTINEPED